MDWYKKASINLELDNDAMIREAGFKENLLTLALASLFMMPIDAMVFKYMKNRKPEVSSDVIVSNLNHAKEIKKNVETGKFTQDEKYLYDNAQSIKNEIKPIEQFKPQEQTIEVAPKQQPQQQTKRIKPSQKQLVISNEVVKVVKQLEGSGANAVSHAGASGVMQIMKPAWEEINQKHFSTPQHPKGKYPYEKYRFDQNINTQFGKLYLELLVTRLESCRNEWGKWEKLGVDPYFYLLASYNTGFERIRKCNFNPKLIHNNHHKAFYYANSGMEKLGLEKIDLNQIKKFMGRHLNFIKFNDVLL